MRDRCCVGEADVSTQVPDMECVGERGACQLRTDSDPPQGRPYRAAHARGDVRCCGACAVR
eukprot:578275-Rhodomonas_salina.1